MDPDAARVIARAWERLLRPEGEAPYFFPGEGRTMPPPFDPGAGEFSPANAWWLSELCRLVYTPDAKEAPRPWHRDKPAREALLAASGGFVETHSIHKTGNHAALFRGRAADGTGYWVLGFRGTNKLRQWIMNLTAVPVRLAAGDEDCVVHQGFKVLFNRVWPAIEPCLAEIEAGPGGPVIYTGHSLGGAFATLAALRRAPDALHTFGSPRVGNAVLRDRIEAGGFPAFRVVHARDIVTQLPARNPDEASQDFRHAGKLVVIGGDGTEDWPPADPLAYLAGSFTDPAAPPDCLSDHLPARYSAALLAAGARS
ncbi:MAG: lipase family protein [Verrucomicrobiae bacterium]|nr:lipase family protein [Verrucomicrobiae bacterium]